MPGTERSTSSGPADRAAAAAARRRITEMRRSIDVLDADLVRLLDRRVALACAIARQKDLAGLPSRSLQRESDVLRRAARQPAANIGPGARRRVLRAVIEETIRIANRTAEQAPQAATG